MVWHNFLYGEKHDISRLELRVHNYKLDIEVDHISFGAHILSRPVHYYIIGVMVTVRVCVLHNAACYVLLSLLL